jgi:EAL and modified HD-GYP domain-containing signal transduction protein
LRKTTNETLSTKKILKNSDKPLVARQPILDCEGKTVAYELLCRSIAPSDSLEFQKESGNQATSEVIMGAFHDIGIANITFGLPAFINLTEAWLHTPPPVQADKLVVEILEYVPPTEANILAVQNLRNLGFKIALDDFAGDAEQAKWIEYVDIVKVDLMQLTGTVTSADLLQLDRRENLIWLAEKVETAEEFERCKAEGYSLFQGYFFSRPNTFNGERKRDNRFAVLRLLKELNKPDSTMNEISEAIQSDPQISYRVLQFINSASVGKVQHINSIQHACTMAGIDRIKGWANILALGRLDHKPRALLEQALSRAYLCQMLAKKQTQIDQHTAYTAGMFSLLDAFIDWPLDRVCKELQLSDLMQDALLNNAGFYGDILKLATAVSKGKWSEITDLPPGISLEMLADMQAEAFKEVSHQLAISGIN